MVDPAHRPSSRAPLRWCTEALLSWLVPVVGQLVWAVLAPEPRWAHVCAAAATAVLVIAHVGVMPWWRYRVHRWEVSPQAVFTRTGWLTQERRIAPLSRVQTVDTQRGPLDRLFGLATVTVTTASSAGAVRIVALDADVADRVVAALTERAAQEAGDAT